jgi:hypothetical protein
LRLPTTILEVWTKIARRAADFSIGFFALLGFVWVPLGERTAWEHLRAVLASEAAVEARREAVEAGRRLYGAMIGEAVAGPSSTEVAPPAPQRPNPDSPRPEPPELARCGIADAGADVSLPWPDL